LLKDVLCCVDSVKLNGDYLLCVAV